MKSKSIFSQRLLVPRANPFHLSRGRLLDLVNQASENKLTIISAPAGYGKTSLLVDFAEKTNYPVCWYGLENTDNQLIQFVEGIIESIQHLFEKFGFATKNVLKANSDRHVEGKVLAAIFINDLRTHVDEHFFIILDDFQLIDTNIEILEFINSVLLESDENLHVIISSRALLGLPDLPLLVARSQVGGLSYEELSFSKEEIKDLILLIQKRTISDAEAENLWENCEGWIMGLLLAMQADYSPVNKLFSTAIPKEIGVNHFLARQVLNSLPEAIQSFLLRSSLFDEFDVELFLEVMKIAGIKKDNWHQYFNYVVEHNLFLIPVGTKPNLYRYHHLFLEFLRGNMERQFPEEARTIKLALAEYYANTKEWSKAFNLYNEIGEKSKKIELISIAAPELIARGQNTELEEWLINIPQNDVENFPALLSTWGVIASNRGDYQEGIQNFYKALNKCDPIQERELKILTYTRRAIAYRFLGDYEKSLNDVEQALQICNSDSKFLLLSADAKSIKGTSYSFIGKWNQALDEINEAQEIYIKLGEKDATAKCSMQIGYVLKSTGKYKQAFENYKKALKHFRESENIIWEPSVLNNMGVLAHIQCDFRNAIDYFEKAYDYSRITKNKRLESYLLASIGDLYADLGINLEASDAYERSLEISKKEVDNYLLPYLYISMSKLETRGQESINLVNKAKQYLLNSPNLSLLQTCEMEEGNIMVKKFNNVSELNKLFVAYDYFSEHDQIIDAITALSIICWCHVKRFNVDQTSRYIGEIKKYVKSHEYFRILVMLMQKSGLVIKDLDALSLNVSEKSHAYNEWNTIIDLKAKARQYYRRRGSVVPLKPAKIKIRTFGRTIVSRSEKVITSTEWRSQAARDLFIFLAIHHHPYTREEIGELFWPDSSTEDLKLRFKNTIYRLRRAVGKDVIKFDDDRYEFNRNMDLDSDFEYFIAELNIIDNANDEKEKISSCLRAVKFYKGPFLNDVDLNWANQLREELKQKYFDCLLKVSSTYLETGKYAEALKFALKACEFDDLSEIAHQLAMRSYGGMGDRSAVIRQYQKLVQNLKQELEIEPSAVTSNLYNLLIR